jgi:hypothetical protein
LRIDFQSAQAGERETQSTQKKARHIERCDTARNREEKYRRKDTGKLREWREKRKEEQINHWLIS